MSPRPETDIGSATLLRALGALLIVLGTITVFDPAYLFTATLPLTAAGVLVLALPHLEMCQRFLAADLSTAKPDKVEKRLSKTKRPGAVKREERRKRERKGLA